MRRLLALLAAITSSSALAASSLATAVLTGPTRAAMVVTDAGLWHCDRTSCTGPASPVLREAVAACTAVAGGAGRVAAFTVGAYVFSDADLVRCNRHVKL